MELFVTELNKAQHFGSDYAWIASQSGQKCLEIEASAQNPSAGGLSFFAPDFALSHEAPWLVGTEVEAPCYAQDAQGLPGLNGHREPNSSEFFQNHADILERISGRQFEKVVPVVSEHFEFSEDLALPMFRAESSEGEWAYGFQFHQEGMVGVTPELLFRVQGSQLTTMALAGTGPCLGPSLLDNSKERLEHQLVIDHIARELKPWGSPSVGSTEEKSFGGKIKHLFTPIKMSLSIPVDFLSLVRALHPTAALGGWPRGSALSWLQHQGFHADRRRFGAPFGYVCGDEMLCVVAIRGLQWQGRFATVSAGCGVVRGSQPENEWEELRLKRRTTCERLGVPTL